VPPRTACRRGRGILVVLVILSRVATAPSFALLYSGLEPSAAGEVVAALEARGVPYQVNGTAIEVDAAQRDALRMSLAGEGLPANGPQGYELLDQLVGLRNDVPDVRCRLLARRRGNWRAQSCLAAHPRRARPYRQPVRRPVSTHKQVTASVAIRPASGGLAPRHAQALRYLVASSVPGLASENVTIIDADSGRVFGADQDMTAGADAAGRAEGAP
jgi:flagellar M-ring protein FliF